MFRPVRTNLKVTGQNCNGSVAHSCKEVRAYPSPQNGVLFNNCKIIFSQKMGVGGSTGQPSLLLRPWCLTAMFKSSENYPLWTQDTQNTIQLLNIWQYWACNDKKKVETIASFSFTSEKQIMRTLWRSLFTSAAYSNTMKSWSNSLCTFSKKQRFSRVNTNVVEIRCPSSNYFACLK